MRRVLVVCAVMALLFLTAAGAAAQSTSDDKDFKGFYVGGYIGGAVGRSDASTTTVFDPAGYFASSSVDAINVAGQHELDPTAFTGGGTFGYNWQSSSNWVFGLETDIGVAMADDRAITTMTYPCCAPTGFTVRQFMNTSWLWTFRPRVGYAAHRTLWYFTGGVAVTDIDYRADFSDTFAAAYENGIDDGTRAGWTLGGGLEFKANKHWSVKGEYLYANFGDSTVTSTNLTTFVGPATNWPQNVFTHTNDLRTHNFRFGVNYRF